MAGDNLVPLLTLSLSRHLARYFFLSFMKMNSLTIQLRKLFTLKNMPPEGEESSLSVDERILHQ